MKPIIALVVLLGHAVLSSAVPLYDHKDAKPEIESNVESEPTSLEERQLCTVDAFNIDNLNQGTFQRELTQVNSSPQRLNQAFCDTFTQVAFANGAGEVNCGFQGDPNQIDSTWAAGARGEADYFRALDITKGAVANTFGCRVAAGGPPPNQFGPSGQPPPTNPFKPGGGSGQPPPKNPFNPFGIGN